MTCRAPVDHSCAVCARPLNKFAKIRSALELNTTNPIPIPSHMPRQQSNQKPARRKMEREGDATLEQASCKGGTLRGLDALPSTIDQACGQQKKSGTIPELNCELQDVAVDEFCPEVGMRRRP